MKKLWILPLCLLIICVGACAPPTAPEKSFSAVVERIDHCVVEPDEAAVMDDALWALYRRLMDSVIAGQPEVALSDDRAQNEFCFDLLMESPYGFLVRRYSLDDGSARLYYSYDKTEQQQIVRFLDDGLLAIANRDVTDEDNELDVILKVYYAVTATLDYDEERTDNKQLASPLFRYPADEIYKALRDKKSLCYGFAYIYRFALLQHGIDCFTVYGECRAHDQGHMWCVFRYDDRFFNCDPAWDRRKVSGYSRLFHFGKTDGEREADTCYAADFSSYHHPEYGAVSCSDDRFSIFRGVSRFSYISGHRFFTENYQQKESIFDTASFTFSE